jgi:hypothetical protein
MNTKLLRIFSVNDETPRDLGTDLLWPVEVADGEGEECKKPSMSQWLQHVHLLGTQQMPTFDLLFIDIRFDPEFDQYAPPYGEESANPMGLLHALTFASRQDPSRSPFVWGYHSGAPKSVMKDPIAIIAFSLLSALEQLGEAGDFKVRNQNNKMVPWRWNDYGLHNDPEYAVAHFSKGIQNLPQGSAEVIWVKMVERYRNKLLHLATIEKAVVEYDELELAYQLASSGTKVARGKLAKLAITISGCSGTRWERVLSLQSLFADKLKHAQPEWPEGERLVELKEFATNLKKAAVSKPTEYWIAHVDTLMRLASENIDAMDEWDAKDPKAEDGLPKPTIMSKIKLPRREKKRVVILAILCWWLSKKAYRDDSFTTKTLLNSFGYKGSHRDVLTGCIEDILGYDSLEEFLEFLETTPEPLQPPFWEVGRYWWDERCAPEVDVRTPQCIS